MRFQLTLSGTESRWCKEKSPLLSGFGNCPAAAEQSRWEYAHCCWQQMFCWALRSRRAQWCGTHCWALGFFDAHQYIAVTPALGLLASELLGLYTRILAPTFKIWWHCIADSLGSALCVACQVWVGVDVVRVKVSIRNGLVTRAVGWAQLPNLIFTHWLTKERSMGGKYFWAFSGVRTPENAHKHVPSSVDAKCSNNLQ